MALKVVDVSLEKVEEALKKIDSDNAKTMSSLVQMVHSTANSLRHGAARSAGTPLAKMIDESSLTGALGEATGLTGLMERLGLAGSVAETPEASTDLKEATTSESSEVAITEETEDTTPVETPKDTKEPTPVETPKDTME